MTRTWTGPSDEEPRNEAAPGLPHRTGGEPENPGEPTPGSDNDGPEEGYTPPEELPPRSAPAPRR